MDSEKKKIAIAFIGSALIVCLFFFFLIYPIFKRIQILSMELTLAKVGLQDALNRTEEMAFWRQRYSEINAHFQILRSVFVDPNFPVDLIKFIEELAEKSGVKAEISLITSASKKEGEAPCMRLGIIVKGDTSNCLAFLDKLENSAYLASVEYFKLFKPENSYQANDEGKTELKMTIKVLVLEYEDQAEN